jgi:hypothetical protein
MHSSACGTREQRAFRPRAPAARVCTARGTQAAPLAQRPWWQGAVLGAAALEAHHIGARAVLLQDRGHLAHQPGSQGVAAACGARARVACQSGAGMQWPQAQAAPLTSSLQALPQGLQALQQLHVVRLRRAPGLVLAGSARGLAGGAWNGGAGKLASTPMGGFALRSARAGHAGSTIQLFGASRALDSRRPAISRRPQILPAPFPQSSDPPAAVARSSAAACSSETRRGAGGRRTATPQPCLPSALARAPGFARGPRSAPAPGASRGGRQLPRGAVQARRRAKAGAGPGPARHGTHTAPGANGKTERDQSGSSAGRATRACTQRPLYTAQSGLSPSSVAARSPRSLRQRPRSPRACAPPSSSCAASAHCKQSVGAVGTRRRGRSQARAGAGAG